MAAANISVPGALLARQLDFNAWEEGASVPWIDEVWDALDRLDDWYKDYQVHWEPRETEHWSLEQATIPQRCWDRIYHVTEGEPSLDRDTGYGDITILKHKEADGRKTVWMSDTRAEIVEHVDLINKLWWTESMPNVTVIINGLGLGMAVNAALKHGAKHVDVVELDPEVIEIIGPNFEGKPVTIHQGDALTKTWPKGKSWTMAWHDIWPTIAEENIPEMDRLHRRYKDRVQWQGSWQRKGCLFLKRQSKELQDALEAGDWVRAKQIDPDL